MMYNIQKNICKTKGKNMKLFSGQKLSICFPIWLLHDTPSGGAYHDLKRCLQETAERGFNCIRFDDGAGILHTCGGTRRGAVVVRSPFQEYGKALRQLDCTGGEGKVDRLQRLLDTLEYAEQFGLSVILSSWYYLHTCWYCDEDLNEELHAIPPHERFHYFAEQLDHLLCEIKRAGLEKRIAFAEIFNEADGLNFINGYGARNHLSVEERRRFREDHEKALAGLRARHPDLLFAYDTYTAWTDPEQMPRNLQVWNFHNYFLWGIYSFLEQRLLQEGTNVDDPAESATARRFMKENPVSLDMIRAVRAGKTPAPEDWIRRVWLYSNLDPRKLPEMDALFEEELAKKEESFKRDLRESLRYVQNLHQRICPDAPLVVGEGVSYIGHKELLCEEHSARYWRMLEYMVRQYREAGISGCVLRTCCGPEDPCWNRNAEQLLRLNRLFQKE